MLLLHGSAKLFFFFAFRQHLATSSATAAESERTTTRWCEKSGGKRATKRKEISSWLHQHPSRNWSRMEDYLFFLTFNGNDVRCRLLTTHSRLPSTRKRRWCDVMWAKRDWGFFCIQSFFRLPLLRSTPTWCWFKCCSFDCFIAATKKENKKSRSVLAHVRTVDETQPWIIIMLLRLQFLFLKSRVLLDFFFILFGANGEGRKNQNRYFSSHERLFISLRRPEKPSMNVRRSPPRKKESTLNILSCLKLDFSLIFLLTSEQQRGGGWVAHTFSYILHKTLLVVCRLSTSSIIKSSQGWSDDSSFGRPSEENIANSIRQSQNDEFIDFFMFPILSRTHIVVIMPRNDSTQLLTLIPRKCLNQSLYSSSQRVHVVFSTAPNRRASRHQPRWYFGSITINIGGNIVMQNEILSRSLKYIRAGKHVDVEFYYY